MRRPLLIALLLVAGCGDGESSAPEPPVPPPSCSAPNRMVDTRCLEPGVADDGCPAGTLGQPDGSCRPAGMRPEDCAEGFVHDGDAACEPLLPPEDCPVGSMAVPGDASCRPVMDCGSGKWGNIPVGANTQYVDQQFGGVSDGSAAAPWTTIGQAVAAAAQGAVIAVAAGSYAEDVILAKSIELHGVCPELVEVVGTGAELSAVATWVDVTIQGLAIRGAAMGLELRGSGQVLLERVWVHDNASRGMNVQGTRGSVTLTLRRSLVERNQQAGVRISGAEGTIEESVVRDIAPDPQGNLGDGILVRTSPTTGAPARATVRRSLIERTRRTGVFLEGGELTVEGTVVRHTQSDPELIARGVQVQLDVATQHAATAVVRSSLLDHNGGVGVYVSAGSQATVESSMIRDTLPTANNEFGHGIAVWMDPPASPPPVLTVRGSLLAANYEFGLYVSGGQATVEATAIVDTQPNAEGLFGRGINARRDPVSGSSAMVTLRGSRLERNHEIGMHVMGSEAIVEGTIVRDTRADAFGRFGRGIAVKLDSFTATPAHTTLRASLLERNREIGIVADGAEATIESTIVAATSANDDGVFGDGIAAVFVPSFGVAAQVVVQHSRIDESFRAGVANFGSALALGGTAIGCAAHPLVGEPQFGVEATLEDRGENSCGCAPAPCVPASAGLEAPAPLSPAE